MPVLNSEDESSEAEGASEEEDGSSSSGSDSGSDSDCGGRMLKPVFVPRKDRVTIHEQEAKARAEEAKMEEQRRAQEQKKESTRVLVAESMRRIADEEAQVDDADEDAGLPDDTDSVDPALELEAWKVREMARLKRDTEERESVLREKLELLRRRGLTDEERLAEDLLSGRVKSAAAGAEGDESGKPKWRFMQKYFHKGAFYMDEDTIRRAGGSDDVRAKNYAAEPTLEDRVDKEQLPQVMQVKNFGKRGRTKYTHLLDQDTTFSAQEKKRVDRRPDRSIMEKYMQKRSGMEKR